MITENQKQALALGRKKGITRKRPKGLKYNLKVTNKGWGLQAGWNKGLRGKFTGKTKDGLHDWVERNLGKPQICEKCDSTKNIEWSNVSGQYIKNLLDWQRLCKKCHCRYDFEKFGARKVFYR